jgi:hypothetical protein
MAVFADGTYPVAFAGWAPIGHNGAMSRAGLAVASCLVADEGNPS